MPNEIFISYSRLDSAQVLALAEKLRENGINVWIDQRGIEAAKSWSTEIANALEHCRMMILILSENSIASENVANELSIAAKLGKQILPIELQRVELKGDFLYHLTRLQRVKYENIDSILQAVGSERSTSSEPKIIAPPADPDPRKSLMILPFEDLSPSADNGWFADGIVSEMISSLSNVKALRLADAQSTKEFKSFKGQLSTYAKEMKIRYFVQGDVRKFGEQIKISSRLLDIQSGDHLWQDSLRGTMDDIFDIQETVAIRVLEGLQVILTP
ncbi:MAG: TIR domain-containing protein, partial [Ignavibacteriota bacterium]